MLSTPIHAGNMLPKVAFATTNDDVTNQSFQRLIDNPLKPELGNKDYEVIAFSLDATKTKSLMASCHGALGTEPIELVIAAALDGFGRAYPTSELPAIFYEASGTNSDADDSSLITRHLKMNPDLVAEQDRIAEDKLLATIEMVKIAYHCHGEEIGSAEAFHDKSMAILFRKLDDGNEVSYATLEIFKPTLDISTSIEQGSLSVEVKYLVTESEQELNIKHWATEFAQSLKEVASLLQKLGPAATLQQYPLLQLQTGDALKQVLADCESQLNASQLADIEEILPCTPMQEGIILAHSVAPHAYQLRMTWEVKPKFGSHPIDLARLQNAWVEIVQRNQIMRTVFVQSRVGKREFVQVVLKNPTPMIKLAEYADESQMDDDIAHLPGFGELQHSFTICQMSSGRVYYRIAMHHSITDGTSISILNRNLMLALDGNLAAQPQSQYSAFVNYLEQSGQDASLSFWKDLLSGTASCTLPSFSTPSTQLPEILQRGIAWDIAQTAEIRSFCKLVDITTSGFFRTIWALVLRCYTRSDDVCFGSMISGRRIPVAGSANILGPMVTVLPCRSQMTGSKSISELFKTMIEDYTKSVSFQHCSFAEIMHEQGLHGQNLFNTVINFMRGHPTTDVLETSQYKCDYVEHQNPAEYDITLEIIDHSETLSMTLNSWTSFMQEEQADCILGTFNQAMTSVMALDLGQTVGELNFFGPIDTAKVQTWYQQPLQLTHSTIHQQISCQAALTPTSTAIFSSDMSLTYAELESLSNRLAYSLIELGIGRGSTVPFCMAKSVWATVAMLGICKAGAAFVPLDPANPPARLDLLVRAAEADVLLTTRNTYDKVKDMKCTDLHLMLVEDVVTGTGSHPVIPLPKVHPQDIAYIIFTSGSTGTPKGVLLSHSAVCGSCNQLAQTLCIDSNSRSLQFSAYNFDAMVCEIFVTLVKGGTIVQPADEERSNELVDFVNRSSATFLFLTPTVLRLFQPDAVQSVTTVVTLGEAIGQDLVELWQEKVVLRNIYGPTETCVACTSGIMNMLQGISHKSIGSPMGCRAWVVLPEDHNQLQPIGSIGELVIESPNIAEGYLKDPEKTSKVFIDTPSWVDGLGLSQGGRFYKCGDLVRQNLDGSLLYFGRVDSQVKVNGQRVELGEVEHHLITLQEIEQAVVTVPKPGDPWSGRLVAVVCIPQFDEMTEITYVDAPDAVPIVPISARSDAMKLISRCRQILEERLPAYMVPSFWVPLYRFPVTSSGKTDRVRISQWLCRSGAQSWAIGGDILNEEGQTQPTTPQQRILQEIWAEVLALPETQIGVDRSFLSLGGDSISAMKVASKTRASGFPVTVKNLLQRKTIQELAADMPTVMLEAEEPEKLSDVSPTPESAITAAQSVDQQIPVGDYSLLQLTSKDALSAILENCLSQLDAQPGDIQDIYPCSPMQEGMLLAQSKSANLYHGQMIWKVKNPRRNIEVGIQKMQQSWEAMVQRHQILRTRFIECDGTVGTFLQVVLKYETPCVPCLEVDALEDVMTAASLVDWDGANELSRFTIYRAQGEDLYCTLALHHAIYDGDSFKLMVKDFTYELNDCQPWAAEKMPTYRDFVAYLTEQDTKLALAHWEATLAGVSRCHFPIMQPADFSSTSSHRHNHVMLSSDQTALIRDLCKTSQVTIPTFFRAVWTIILRCYTGSDDICFGAVASGRDVPVLNAENIVGPLLTLLVCRTQVDASKGVMSVMEDIQNNYLDSLPFQHFPLAKIHHALKFRGGEQLFNTTINFLTGSTKSEYDETWAVLEEIEGVGPVEYDVSLTIEDYSTSIALTLDYWESCFSTQQADSIVSTICQVITSILADPAQKIGNLDLFSRRDAMTVQTWYTDDLRPIYDTIHERITRQALMQPTKVAIGSTTLDHTYSQLEMLSDGLARTLLALGVKRGDIVPFCMEKSVWATVAMLGVMKAGAAFLPLDPAHPNTRLEWFLQQVDAHAVLCSRETVKKVQSLHHEEGPANNMRHLVMVDDEDIYAQVDERIPLPLVSPSDTAYLCFTSGSSGTPKGVQVSHETACSGITQCSKVFQIDASSRVLHFSAHTWDATICEVFSTLDSGGSAYVPSDVERMDGIVEFVNRFELNWLFLTPTVLRLIQPEQVSGHITIVTIGELLGQDLIERWHERALLINSYGPTEACVAFVAEVVKKGASSHAIGKPFGSRAWVVLADDHERLAPIGCIGELLVEGPNVSQGYFKDEERTAAAFLSHQPAWVTNFDLSFEHRYYKTGDLVKQNFDGSLTFIGRKDNQVKVNGQRVELGEIEFHLLQVPAVRYALAMVPKAGPWTGRVVAVLSPEYSDDSTDGSSLDVANPFILDSGLASRIVDMQQALQNSLPVYMIPTVWFPVARLPVTSSGKMDRAQVIKWLLAPSEETVTQIQDWATSTAHASNNIQQQPTTFTQERLQKIWAGVLQLPVCKVGVDRSFMSLGGDSISAMKVASQSRAQGIDMTVQDLLRRMTIMELASLAEDHASSLLIEDSKRFRLSGSQAYRLASDQSQLGHQGLLIHVPQAVNFPSIVAAIRRLVDRHPVLRARIRQDKTNGWVQEVIEDQHDSWICSQIHRVATMMEIEAIHDSRQNWMAVGDVPVLAVDLIQSENEALLNCVLLTAHSMVADTHSWQIIFEHLEEALRMGAPLPPVSVSFQAWVNKQSTLPEEAPISTYQVNQETTTFTSFSVSKEETEALMNSCNTALRTNPHDLIIAAALDAFGRVFDDRDLPSVLCELDGRQCQQVGCNIANTVGMFTEIVPVAYQELQCTAIRPSAIEAIMMIKDSLASARRTLSGSKNGKSFSWLAGEMLFRAFSTTQEFGGDDTMLRAKVLPGRPHKVSTAVFELAPTIHSDVLTVQICFPTSILQNTPVVQWIEECGLSLRALIQLTNTLEPRPTLQDYPLLQLTSYAALDEVAQSCRSQLGLTSLAEIEDIYPCSPMQEGIILAQAKEPSSAVYDQRLTWRVEHTALNLRKFEQAWSAVIKRHSMLRTVFIEYPLPEHHVVQVVLHSPSVHISWLKAQDFEHFQTGRELEEKSQNKVLHQLTVCETETGEIYCRWDFNHTLSDATSVRILLHDLQVAYDGLLEADTESPYSEFIFYLSRQDPNELSQYWEANLAGVEVCAFPKHTEVDYDNLHTRNTEMAQKTLNLNTDQVNKLRNLSSEYGITTATLSNTIWSLILRTFMGRENVCFGYLASGRDIDLAGVQNMLGPLITLLVCHINIQTTTSLLDIARSIQDNYLQSLAVQHYSLAEVYHKLGLQGEHLFNTVVNVLQTQPVKESSKQSLNMIPVNSVTPSEFDVSLDVLYCDTEAKMILTYRLDYINESLASSIMATISRILNSLLDNPKLQVGQLLICDELQQQVLSNWKLSDDIESQLCLHESIEERVKKTPNAQAVCAHDGDFSYQEVWDLTDQLAHKLVTLGVGPNVYVPFCLEKSRWAVITIVAILKAGGCCVPLDPSFPEVRLRYMIELIGATVILSSPEHTELVKHLVPDSLTVDASFFAGRDAIREPLVTGLCPSDPAYIIFSSGTTGNPKGTVLEHRSIQHSSRILDGCLNFGPDSRVLQFSSFVFDVSIEEVVCTLMFGGCVCVPSEAERMNNLASAMERMRVNWIDFTPTLLRTISPAAVPHLKTLCLGGELLGDDLIRLWSPHVDMFNIFGPSECSITLTSSKNLQPGDSGTNIGKGYGCRFWIVDPKNHNVISPVGAIGEMLVEGGQVGREYYKNPSQSAAAFIENPQWSIKSSGGARRRMYKTGDLARFDQSGSLVYLGRKDQQVKIRGQRVEIADVEYHISAHPAINSAVALVPSQGWSKGSLVAVVVLEKTLQNITANKKELSIHHEALRTNASSDLSELAASLKLVLPRQMIPSTIIPVYSLPLLLSGKANRRVLKQWIENMDRATSEIFRGGTDAMDMPTNEVEKQIQLIWSQVLDLPLHRTGVKASFLSLGGDSISAIKVASKSRALGVTITVQDLLSRNTIADIARSSSVQCLAMAQHSEILDQSFKFSPAQAVQLAAGNDGESLYSPCNLLLCVRQTIEADVLFAAVQLLVKRHSMLRARFWYDVDGAWKQKIVKYDTTSWTWRIHNMSTIQDIELVCVDSASRLSHKDAPVFAVDLIRLEDGPDHVLLTANGLVVDLKSWQILFEDLDEILQTGAILQPSSTPYQTWIHAETKFLDHANEDLTSQYCDAISPSQDRHQISFSFSEEESKALTTLCNDALHTKPSELIAAAIIFAFGTVFGDSNLPKVFSEFRKGGHRGVDVTRTVGPITQVYQVAIESTGPIMKETIKQVKDAFRNISTAAGPYHGSMDILFRSFDDLETLGGSESMIHAVSGSLKRTISSRTPHPKALIEIVPSLEHGALVVDIHFSKDTAQGGKSTQWAEACRTSLQNIIRQTLAMKPEPTLYDYQLLHLNSYTALDELLEACRSQLDLQVLGNVEDIYPCSPMQEGMLLAQSKSAKLYNSQMMWRIKAPFNKVVIADIERTWQALFQRHAVLRTHFIEANGTFLQVVMAHQNPKVHVLTNDGQNDMSLNVSKDTRDDKSDCNFTIVQTIAGDTYIKLGLNHAIYDADSLALLMRDFTFELNGHPLVKDVPSYRDFIAHLTNQQPDSEAHWREQLAGAAICKFPVSRPADFANGTYVRKQAVLTAQQTLAIRTLCRATNVTMSAFFRVIWTIILRCFTGSEDTCFGAVASGRDIPLSSSQDIMGPMLSLLVCRTQVDSSSTFRSLLESMQCTYLKNLAYQHFSLAKIYHILGLSGGEQLFNTTVNFLVREPDVESHYDKSWTVLEEIDGNGLVEYDVSFTVEDLSTTIAVSLDYWDSCLSGDQASSVIGTICQTITSIVTNPEQKVKDLDLLSAGDAWKMNQWYSNGINEPVISTIHAQVEQRCVSQPDKVALSSTAGDMTYGKLDRLACSVAQELRYLQVGSNDAVAFCMDKSVWAVVAMLGVLKSGAAFVPLDPAHPPARLGLIIEEANICVLMCSRNTHEKARKIDRPGLKVVVLEDAAEHPLCPPPALPLVDPQDTAYIIFTSGSTGKPKGVYVSHSAAAGGMAECAKAFNMNSDSRALQFSAYTWDAIICEIFSTLDVGGTIFVPTEEERMNGLSEFIEKWSLNWLFLTPTVLRLLQPERLEGQDLTIVTIGEPLGKDLSLRWHDKAVLINAYGPTETCVACTAGVIDSVGETAGNSIGKPFGCRAWVVLPENHDHLAPIGGVGELMIESPNLARGYYGDAQKTADLFFTKPSWAPETKNRIYKTGDLVRQAVDGSLIFLARKDTQVKVNGQRVELGEVEYHLQSLEGIQLAVTFVPKLGPLSGKLVAVISISHYDNAHDHMAAADTIPPVSSSLRAKLATEIAKIQRQMEDKVPSYMVPTQWIPLSRLPMLSSGKIDRAQIQRWIIETEALSCTIDDHALQDMQLQPATSMEVILQGIWADVLGLAPAKVGTDRSFTSLGGDSILAMRIAARCRTAGVPITVQDLLLRRTIVDLAKVIRPEASSTELLGTNEQQASPIRTSTMTAMDNGFAAECASQLGVALADIEDIYPCSPMQEGILLARARSSHVYNQRLTWKISSPTNPAYETICKFQEAWQDLVDDHTILRTAFIEDSRQGSQPFQVVLRHFPAPMSQLELDESEQFEAQKVAEVTFGRVLHHLTICKSASAEIFATLDFNHALGDATSVQILVQDLCLAFDGRLRPGAPPYAGFVSHLMSHDSAKVQMHWERELTGVEACTFPKQYGSNKQNVDHGQEVLKLSGAQIKQLRKLCNESNITIAAVSNTLWALVLHFFLGREDICFGYLASGRDIDVPGIEDMLGPMVTLLACHITINPAMPVIDLARATHGDYIRSLPVQHYSLAKVYHALGLQGDRLFNTVVNVLHGASSAGLPNVRGLSMTPIEAITPSEFDISFDVAYSDTEATMSLSYGYEYLSKGLASSVMNTLSRILFSVLDDPNIKIGQLEVCTEAQQASLSAASDPVEPEKCIHDTIEQWTLKSPNAQAICAHDGELTYTQLSSLSDFLSCRLIALGIKSGIYVPFCFEKSKWSVVAILAILKSGGCCVPLDPSYPTARLGYVVDLVEAAIVLTSDKHNDLVRHMVPNPLVINDNFFASCSEMAEGVSQAVNVQTGDAAYVIFSSGTTGEPKGSILEHSALSAFCRVLGSSLNVNSQSRVLQFASFAFDLSIEEILGTLTQGGCVCIPSEDDRLDNLASAMERLQVTWANLTPTVLRTIKSPADVPHLETLVTAGEMLSDDLIQTWASTVDLYNTYGPSECTVAATITNKIKLDDTGANIGKGRSCKIWVANPNDQHLLSPIGAVGEIIIEGRQVGRGYMKRPEQTAAAFIKNPAWARQDYGERKMYKSGDLGRLQDDGTLIYLGRKDQQIKIRGQRVELTEIEHQFGKQAAISAAAAALPRNGCLKGRLVAAVVLSTNTTTRDTNAADMLVALDDEAIRTPCLQGMIASLEQTLPRYMVPSLIIPIKSLPLLLSGKVNRRAFGQWLESLDETTCELLTSGENNSAIDQPTKASELQIQAVWGRVLGLPLRRIGVNSLFFSLGGDSILAMRMSSELREQGMKVSVQDIFEHKTISKLAASAERNAEINKTVITCKTPVLKSAQIEAVFLQTFGDHYSFNDVENAYPCTAIQESILTAQVLEPHAWNAVLLFEAQVSLGSEAVDVFMLEAAWSKVVSHHAILRTVFVPVYHQGVWQNGQVVLKHIKPTITTCQINGNDLFSIELHPVDLSNHLPAHQMTILTVASGAIAFKLQLSHTLYDAMAMSILIKDLRLAYDGLTLEATIPYITYCESTQLSRQVSDVEHWKSLLRDYTPKTIDFGSSEGHSATICMRTVQGDISATRELHNYCQVHSMTIANLFQSVWAMCLRDISRTDDICFGNMISGRELAGTEASGAVGACVNVLPCRIQFAPTTTIQHVHTSLQTDLYAALANQHCFSEAFETRGKPLFDTYLNVRRTRHQSRDCASALSLRNVDSYMFEQYQVVVYVDELDDGINISLSYRSPNIPEARAAELLSMIQDVLKAMINSPITRCATFV